MKDCVQLLKWSPTRGYYDVYYYEGSSEYELAIAEAKKVEVEINAQIICFAEYFMNVCRKLVEKAKENG